MRKKCVRKGVEYIGSRLRKRRQKGRFLPVDKSRQKTLFRRRVTTKRLTLPNGQSFLCRYEGVCRKILPRNVTITRTQKIGPRRQRKTHQGGSILGNRHLPQQVCWKKGFVLVQGTLNSEFGKKLVDEGMKHTLELYKFGISKIKKKAWKELLNGTLLATQLKKHRKKLSETYLVDKNEHWDKKFSYRKGPGRHKRSRHKWQFCGCFSGKRNEQVCQLKIIVNLDAADKNGTHWWCIVDIELQTDLLFFDMFGVDGLKSFIIHDDKKMVEKYFLGLNS